MKNVVLALILVVGAIMASGAMAQETKWTQRPDGGWIANGPGGFVKDTFRWTKPVPWWESAFNATKSGAKFAAKRAGWVGLVIVGVEVLDEFYPLEDLAADAGEIAYDAASTTGDIALDVVEGAFLGVLFVYYMGSDLVTGNW